jgi:hypothetical protein
MNRWEWRGNSTTTAVMVDGDAWTAAKESPRARGTRLPVVLRLSPSRTHWLLFAGLTLLGSGSGRLVEWHRLGCKCEAPGVC